MATSGNGNRDVTLNIGAKTSGEDQIRGLASEVQRLAKTGGEAAPAFEKLASELDQLADQAGSLDSFRQAAADVDALAAKQGDAAAKANTLRDALTQQRAALTELKTAQAGAKTAYDEQARALADAQYRLAELNIEYPKGERGAASYKQQLKQLSKEVLDAGVALKAKKTELAEANAEASKAESAEGKLVTAYTRAAKAAEASAKALQGQREVMAQAGAAAEQLGVATDDLAGSQQRIQATQQQLQASVAATAEASQRHAAAAADEAAALAAMAREVKSGQQALDELAVAQQRAAVAADAQFAATVKLLKAQDDLQREAVEADLAFGRRVKQLREQALASEQAAAAAEKLKLATQGVSDELKGAFGAAGLRSLQAIQAEANQVTASVDLLKREFRAGAISAQDLARAVAGAEVRLAQLNQEARNVPALPGEFERLSAAIGGAINKFGALGAAMATAGVAVKPVIDATIALERMERVLTTVTGSASVAKEQIEFLRQVSQRAGQSFNVVGDEYAKFAASALSAGVPLRTVQKVFESTALAAGNLGLTSDQTARILNALGQSASKGVIQMEELRGQLGDALPGAMSLMAKGLGLTDQQLVKLVESGGLLARDALPALAEALVQLGPKGGGAVQGLVAEFNRLKNVVLEAGTTVANGAFGQALGATLSFASAAIQRVVFGVALIGESFTVVGKQIGAVTAAVVTRDFKGLGDALAQIENESTEKLAGLADRITGTGTAAKGAAADVGTLAGQMTATATAIGTQTAALGENTDTWLRRQVQVAEALASAEKESVTAGKVAEAKKTEGEALARVIELGGNEVEVKEAQAEAAREYAAALEAQAAADEAVASLAQRALKDMQDRVAAMAQVDEASTRELEKLRLAADAKSADAQRTRAQAEAARVAALAAGQLATSLGDSSVGLEQYRNAVAGASAAVAIMTRELKEGRGSKEALTRATEALKMAEGLLRDAISDTAKAVQFSIEVMRAEGQVEQANLQIKLSKAKVMEQEAILAGDEIRASRARVAQKEIELQILKAVVGLSEREAQTRLDAAQKALEEAQALGGLLPEKERELQLRVKIAEAAVAESKAKAEGVKVTEAETRVLKQNTEQRERNAQAGSGGGGAGPSSSTSSAGAGGAGAGGSTLGQLGGGGGGSTPGISGIGTGGGSRPNTAPGVTAEDVKNDPYGRNAEQIANMRKQGGPVDNTYVFQLRERLRRGDTFDKSELPAIQNALRVAKENARIGQPGSVDLAGRRDDQAWVNVLTTIAEKAAGNGFAGGYQGVPEFGYKAGGGAAAGQGGSYTVNVNLGGSTRTINTASAADADALAALLRELQSSQGRAG